MQGSLTIFPNPARSALTVKAISPPNKELTIEIKTIFGQSLQSQTVQSDSQGHFMARFDISNLNSGSHIVDIKTDETKVSRVFVKH